MQLSVTFNIQLITTAGGVITTPVTTQHQCRKRTSNVANELRKATFLNQIYVCKLGKTAYIANPSYTSRTLRNPVTEQGNQIPQDLRHLQGMCT